MTSLIEGAWALVLVLFSGDAWEVSEAIRHPGAYLLGVPVVLIGGILVLKLIRAFPRLDRHFERTILVSIYLTIAGIIFVEVIRRFVFHVQAPWSTTLPPFLFLIMTWVGCAANIRTRSHLSFNEFRTLMPRPLQFACLCLDTVLWLAFAVVVIVTTFRQAANSAGNFQIMLGTDNVMQWWFYICVPLAWILLSARVLGNFQEDRERYHNGEPLTHQAAIGAD